MRVHLFSAKRFDRTSFDAANKVFGHDLRYVEAGLNADTVELAAGARAVCAFVSDLADDAVLTRLQALGVRHVALRSAGYDRVDLVSAKRLNIDVVRVPAYSPYAIAEHVLGLVLLLNRKLHRAWARVREGNFALDGLVGFDLHGKTVGLIGTGRIGMAAARAFVGLGCTVLAHDLRPDDAATAIGVRYVTLEELLRAAHIVSLHVPLNAGNRHLMNAERLAVMKPGAFLINASRGGLLDTDAAIAALKSGHLGALGLDVYEGESGLFFEDRSGAVLQDDRFSRLLTFPNVVITGHQAFLTVEALANIADTTLGNLTTLERGETCVNAVTS